VPAIRQRGTSVRAWIIRRWPLGPSASSTVHGDVLEAALPTRLIGESEMRHYFPTANIRRERVLGMTKSVIATEILSITR
jgi:hypothetical protein